MPSSEAGRTNAFAAFEHRDFRLFQVARLCSLFGLQMQTVAVGWQVYTLTHDPLQLGYVGLVQFLPAIGLSLITGDAADRYDRRKLLYLSGFVLTTCAALLLLFTVQPRTPVWGIYVVLFVVGCARAFSGPAGQALMPNLVPPRHFQNAVAWGSSVWQIATVAGPALGGVIYGWSSSAALVYAITTLFQLSAAVLYSQLRTQSGGRERSGAYWSRLSAGLAYVWREKLILGAISLDLFAVLFGGAVALLPVFASDILHVGPTGLGLLRSAPAFGALLTAVVLAYHPLLRRAGDTMFACVAVFGVCMIVFGLSRNFALSLLVLAISGAADMVSVFVRHTLVQLETPDEMRGRVSAVNLVFIGASNELGEFESGVTAAVFGTAPAVVIGGLGTLIVVGLGVWLFPTLRRVDRLQSASDGAG